MPVSPRRYEVRTRTRRHLSPRRDRLPLASLFADTIILRRRRHCGLLFVQFWICEIQKAEDGRMMSSFSLCSRHPLSGLTALQIYVFFVYRKSGVSFFIHLLGLDKNYLINQGLRDLTARGKNRGGHRALVAIFLYICPHGAGGPRRQPAPWECFPKRTN